MATTIFGDTAQSYWQKVTLMTTLMPAGSSNPWDFEDMLEMYYLNNGLYDMVQKALYENAIWTEHMKPLRNPAHRTVEFHASHIWPGQLSKALPILTPKSASQALVPAIQQIWTWSNWQAKKQLAARWLAEFGTMLIKVATKSVEDVVTRVSFQLLKPQYITTLITDSQDYITFCRIDTRVSMNNKAFWRTEVWNKDAGLYQVFAHQRDRTSSLDQLGAPIREATFEELGIDFVPIAHAKFQDIGEARGLGSFVHALDKIDEAARQATRLHEILFRYNKPTKAISANAMDANGRPLPPPMLQDAEGNLLGAGEAAETGDDDDIVSLPGMSKIEYLIPNIAYDAALHILQDQMSELEEDLPEMAYYRLKADSNISGRALRMKISGAIDRCLDARGNAESALIRANQMALSIAKFHELEGFTELGDFDNGDLNHTIAERDVIPMDKQEQAEVYKTYHDAGMASRSAAKQSGFSEAEIAEIVADEDAQRTKEQGSLGQVMLEMQRRQNGGQ